MGFEQSIESLYWIEKIFFSVFSLLQVLNCDPVLTGPKHTLKNVFH